MTDNMAEIGGGFLLATTSKIFVPEDFGEEQRLIAKTTEDFVRHEVWPRLDEIENQVTGVSAGLMLAAGELGLLMADIPSAYGGLGLDKATSALITEKMGMAGSFSVTHAAHTGIATLPIVFFGTQAQKEKYLPGLAEGKIGAYCLTEPGSGSDALAAKATAVLSADGRFYRLNGTKQFITNAAWAQTFIVFAKIDGQQFSAFIVERDMPGVSIGPEEKKLGIKGSSTASLILEDAEVPVENLLGDAGKGHLIAFNILNIGRYKLGAGVLGAAKLALAEAVKYAQERQQFKRPLSEFGLIRQKMAAMAARIMVAESLVYRTVGLIDERLLGCESDDFNQILKSIEEYAVECSIAKVYGTEMVDMVVDEALQVFGGYGFCQEYPLERLYRDARINRIFEGTNEINRLLIPGQLLRRALNGDLPLMRVLERLREEVTNDLRQPQKLSVSQNEDIPVILEGARKAVLMTAGLAVEKHLKDLGEQQELLALMADMIMEYFALESSWLRLKKIEAGNDDWRRLALQSYLPGAMQRLRGWGREIIGRVVRPAAIDGMSQTLDDFCAFMPGDMIALRDRLAGQVIDSGGYPKV